MERIGFIGLGIMGQPMARNLLRAGFPLTVYTRDRRKIEAFVEQGANGANSPREVAERSTVVITMLPDSPEVEEVALGPNGVIEGIQSGSLFIDMSTIDPSVARKLHAAFAERGVEALDAPVSGGQIGAEQGTLSIMVGGAEGAFQRALPVFQAMGKNITHVGGPGAGQVAKACNQVVVALTIQAVAEALLLAEKAGVDPARVRQALLGGFAHSRISGGAWATDARARLRARLPGSLAPEGPPHRPEPGARASRSRSSRPSRSRRSSTACWRGG
jgi:2-hydroxy-3-oxopropionate reductase